MIDRSRKVAFLLVLLIGCSWQTTGGRPVARAGGAGRHLIMISIDGLVPDYYTDPLKLGMKTPHLSALAASGGYADGVEGVYPSVTYPSHTTLVTGVPTARHGIVHDEYVEVRAGRQV